MQNKEKYGVIGAGSFGTVIANILAENGEVMLFSRRREVYDAINGKGVYRDQKMHKNIKPVLTLQDLCEQCSLIFPIVSSKGFKATIQNAAPYLRPDHILIHGTKGIHLNLPEGTHISKNTKLSKEHIQTMTELITDESNVIRVGCLAGPNLAREIAKGEPAATVVASRFEEVIELGKEALKSSRFRVYGSHDLTGVELAGVLKNIMAIAAGALSGMGFGENAKAMLISRGLGEMVKIGKALGADTKAFFGLAGIGDLIATCSSPLSRNFTVGNRLAKGETMTDIMNTMTEVAEGVNTVKLAKGMIQFYQLETPIVAGLYQVLYENLPIQQAIAELMEHPFDVDVDFLSLG